MKYVDPDGEAAHIVIRAGIETISDKEIFENMLAYVKKSKYLFRNA